MSLGGSRRYFVVKHGLDAFQAMPNFIWRTNKGPDDIPHRFRQVKSGDRWIGFAYTTSDNRERPLSLVTGFYECTEKARHDRLPPEGVAASDGIDLAWLIEGKPFGTQPRNPVGVPPISDLLGKPLWNNQAIVPITAQDFEYIRDYALSHQFDASKIPLLGREPECEQEVLASVVYGYRELGIEQIIRVRKAFPDLLVRIEGNPSTVHLELEVYSEGFFLHGHDKQVEAGCFTDGLPVAVLCWIDNEKKVKNYVHRVYELQSLIRGGKKIVW